MDFDSPETWTDEQRERFRVVQSYEAALREKQPDLYSYYLKCELNNEVLPHYLGIQLTNILEKDFGGNGVLLISYFLTFRRYTEYQYKIRPWSDE